MVKFRAAAVIDAVIVLLRAEGLVVGDGEKPVGAGWQTVPDVGVFKAYVTVWPFSVRFDGTLGVPFDDGDPVVSVNCFGDTASVARQVADLAWTALVDGVLVVDGRDVIQVTPLDDMATDRDDSVQPPIWQDVRRYRISTTTV